VQDASGIPISTATSDQISPTLAWDGTNFLVAWMDLRSGPTYDIYGTRVSAAGAVQNSAGIPISTAADNQYFPALEWDGTNFLVAWQDFRSGTSFDIYGARVSAAGAVQDAAGIPISTAASDQLRPALAWNGSNYLVAWEDLRSGTTLDIYGARVSAAGAVQDAAGIPISTAANHQAYPDLAWDSTNYLVVWTDFRVGTGDIYGTRVNTAGAVQDAAGIPISTAAGNQLSPALAWDGSNHLVAWEDARSGSDVYGARVSAAGAVQDGAGVALAASAASESAPAVTSGPAGRAAVVYRHRPSLISANPQITLRFFDEDPASVLCGRSLPTLAGDQGADTLTGTPDDDVIVGLGGNDTIDGLGGNDRICGGDGQDRITGGEGNDIIAPGPGDDNLAGGIDAGPGSDVLSYAAAPAGVTVDLSTGTATGGDGSDSFTGFENVEGSGFADTLTGDGGRNNLFGLAGNDILNGGGLGDGLDPGPGVDVVNGGTGFDNASYFFRTAPVTLSLDGLANDGEIGEGDNIGPLGDVEALQGGSGADILTGNDAGNNLFGQAGADILNGGIGNDGLDSGPGADTLNGGAGFDIASYFFRAAGVTLSLDGVANDGETDEGDNIGPSGDVEGLQGGRGDDTLFGNGAVNRLNGQMGNDTITSRDDPAQADTVLCGAGTDTVTADNLDLFPETPNPSPPARRSRGRPRSLQHIAASDW